MTDIEKWLNQLEIRLMRAGKLAAYKNGQRFTRILREDLLAYLRARRTK